MERFLELVGMRLLEDERGVEGVDELVEEDELTVLDVSSASISFSSLINVGGLIPYL